MNGGDAVGLQNRMAGSPRPRLQESASDAAHLKKCGLEGRNGLLREKDRQMYPFPRREREGEREKIRGGG